MGEHVFRELVGLGVCAGAAPDAVELSFQLMDGETPILPYDTLSGGAEPVSALALPAAFGLGAPDDVSLPDGTHLRLTRIRKQVLDVLQHSLARPQFVELVLAEIADAQILRSAADALQQRQLLRNRLHKSRLALPVGADYGDPVVEIEAQADTVQHGLARSITHIDLV